MSYRFFLAETPASDVITLEGDQAHHAIQVMRFKVDDQVVLFDGSGLEYHAVIEEVAKKRLSLKILDSIEIRRTLSTHLTLAIAMPKGDRQKFLIEKLVELGVECFVPLKTARSVAVANDKVIQRLRKQVIEASKQCGRNTLMEVTSEQSVTQFADSLDSNCQKFIADPYQGRLIAEVAIEDASQEQLNPIAVMIGPEGGFDASENELAHSLGFKPLRLGSAILRVETAALAIAAIFGIGNEMG